MVRLQELLEWASLSNERHVSPSTVSSSKIPALRPRPSSPIFSETGMRGFYAVPLTDNDGRVGPCHSRAATPTSSAPPIWR